MNIHIPNILITIISITQGVSDDFIQAITSCINQSYDNIEIIVVNYGNKECSIPLKDKRITLFQLLDSTIAKAKNFGLEQARGEMVTFLESHQEIHEQWIQKAAERFHLSKADAIQCGTMYERDKKIEKLEIADDSIFGFYQRLLIKNTIPINSIVVKRDICSNFPVEKKYLMDWEFWINTLKGKKVDVQGEYFGSIIHLKEPLNTKNTLAYEKERLEIMEKYFKDLSFSPKKIGQWIAIKRLQKQLHG